jgi:carbon-monoxide dehydrogenase iron sulfur subunit
MVRRLAVVDVDRCVGCQVCMFACARRSGVGGIGSSRIGIRSAGGMRKGFVAIVCRACDDPPCARACPAEALRARPGGGVVLHADLCVSCRKCQHACPFGAVFWDDEASQPLICVYCGVCASYCPHDVLAHEEIVGRAHAPG